MQVPHKHAALIHAWADGASIQRHSALVGRWMKDDNPGWYEDNDYRVTPEPKPDVVEWRFVGREYFVPIKESASNLKLTFDGETGKLKAAEVL
jgi:hypothetical protein